MFSHEKNLIKIASNICVQQLRKCTVIICEYLQILTGNELLSDRTAVVGYDNVICLWPNDTFYTLQQKYLNEWIGNAPLGTQYYNFQPPSVNLIASNFPIPKI